MRPTVPDFKAERLAEAREARGITQTALADIVGVSRQAVSQYEAGKSAPSRQVFAELARALRFPEHRFLRPMASAEIDRSYFRSLSAATKTARSRALRRQAWLRDEICDYLDRFIVFPEVKFPAFDVPADPMSLDQEDIEHFASETRRAWGLGDGPVSDVVLLLENHGAVVVQQDLGASTLDAMSCIGRDNRPFIALGTEKSSAVRSRFDSVHELGHVILHRRVDRSRMQKPEIYKRVESQAHAFARAFLLPEDSFSESFLSPVLDSLITLKAEWKVSIAAMIIRAEELGLITKKQAKNLHANKSRRWGRRHEPLDDSLPIEQPRFIRRAFGLLLDQDLVSANELEHSIALYIEDIESAAGLEPGFFGDQVQHLSFPRLREESVDTFTPNLPFDSPTEPEPPLTLSTDVLQG